MIQIESQDPCRRKHTRVDSPVLIELGAERLETVDWSPGGVRVARVPAHLRASQVVGIRVAIALGDVWVAFEARARVVHLGAPGGEASGEAGLAFVALPPRARAMLRSLAAAAREGAAAQIEAAPPDLAPPDLGWGLALSAAPAGDRFAGSAPEGARPPAPGSAPERAPAAPVTPPAPVPRGSAVRALLYLVFGLILSFYLGDSLYRRVWRIEVDAAALVARSARIASPVDGVLTQLEVAPGERVEGGAALFRVESPGVGAAIEQAALAVRQAAVHVQALEAARRALGGRLRIHGEIVRSRVESHATQIALLGDRLALADGQIERMRALHTQGMVSQVEVDELVGRRAVLAGERERAHSLLATGTTQLDAASRGYYFSGDTVGDGLPELDASLVAARAQLALEEEALLLEQRRAERAQEVRAPFAGRVAEVLQTSGTPVRQGSLVLVVERADERMVEVWLTRQQAEYVALGDTARISVAGLGREYDGVVRSIGTDATTSVSMAQVGTDPRLQVFLELQGYASAPATAELALNELLAVDSVGLPAVVSFSRSWR